MALGTEARQPVRFDRPRAAAFGCNVLMDETSESCL